ncbi:hypothetical protein ACFO3M_11405, partial [Geodermatophilus arenarius]
MAIDRAPAPSSATLPDDLSLAGLFGLLDRAHELPRRSRPRRAVTTRSPGAPRALRPLPVARPVPVPRPRPVPPAAAAAAEAAPALVTPALVTPAPVTPAPAAGPRWRARLRASVRRLAMWGAGPDGAHAAWPTAPVVVPPAGPGLVRRLALWGAGPDGAHLAWGRPRPAVPAVPRPRVPDGPVVLTELPSTPTIRPAASSPAAASLPAGAGRPVPPRPAAPRSAGPALAPAGWPARPIG